MAESGSLFNNYSDLEPLQLRTVGIKLSAQGAQWLHTVSVKTQRKEEEMESSLFLRCFRKVSCFLFPATSVDRLLNIHSQSAETETNQTSCGTEENLHAFKFFFFIESRKFDFQKFSLYYSIKINFSDLDE